MIDANLEKGTVRVTGTQDIILTEYTVVTRVILHQLTQDLGKEAAFKVLAGLGQIAAKDIDDLGGDLKEMYETIEEVYHDEV